MTLWRFHARVRRPLAERLPASRATLTPSLKVARALPRRERRRVGPFVFLDHFGPTPHAQPMEVPPHPHVGLQTVTYLFEGAVRHRRLEPLRLAGQPESGSGG